MNLDKISWGESIRTLCWAQYLVVVNNEEFFFYIIWLLFVSNRMILFTRVIIIAWRKLWVVVFVCVVCNAHSCVSKAMCGCLP